MAWRNCSTYFYAFIFSWFLLNILFNFPVNLHSHDKVYGHLNHVLSLIPLLCPSGIYILYYTPLVLSTIPHFFLYSFTRLSLPSFCVLSQSYYIVHFFHAFYLFILFLSLVCLLSLLRLFPFHKSSCNLPVPPPNACPPFSLLLPPPPLPPHS